MLSLKRERIFFGTRDGYVVNLLLRETGSNETRIYRQVNVEHRIYKNYVLCLDGQGITTDPEIYLPFMDDLVEYLSEVVNKG